MLVDWALLSLAEDLVKKKNFRICFNTFVWYVYFLNNVFLWSYS